MVLKYYKNIDDRNVFEEALKYFNNIKHTLKIIVSISKVQMKTMTNTLKAHIYKK